MKLKMKRKRILLIGSIVCACGMWMGLHSKTEIEDDLLLLNAEALADDEYVDVGHCLEVGNVPCPLTNIKVKYVFMGWSLNE